MKKYQFSLLLVIVALGLFGCQILGTNPLSTFSTPDTSRSNALPTSAAPNSQGSSQPTAIPANTVTASEPFPGLDGKWEYYSASGTHLYDFEIDWDGQTYRIENCVGYGDVVCELRSQSWDGTTLTWTNYYPHTDYTTTHTYISVIGDTLTVARSGTAGEGTSVFRRAP